VISAARAAENEATFRELNEKLEQRAEELDLTDTRTPYLCECDEERCTKVVLLAHDEYEAVRAHPRTFVLMSGHQAPDDRVLREDRDYVIVEKTGEKANIVEQRDPRA
jgi:ABC-type sulfate/molybdate transport systems ATPase subunit